MADLGYGVFRDPYTYQNSPVLKNRLGIRDAATLEAFEVEASSARAEQPMPAGDLSAAHYRSIHRHLFGDVYRWAGRYRTVRLSKDGNPFCFPENIVSSMDRLFGAAATKHFQGLSFSAFLLRGAAFLAELNAIHAFREGNGRTQLAFIDILARNAGHPLALQRIKRARFLPAMIASFDGDLKLLVRELARLRE